MYKDPEKHREYNRNYMKMYCHTEKYKQWRRAHQTTPEYRLHRNQRRRARAQAHPEIIREQKRGEYRRLKERLFHLFGSKCAYCGCDDPRLLQLNHKNGGGRQDKRHGRSTADLAWSILSGKRDSREFELTCPPCNMIHYVGLKFGVAVANRFTINYSGE